jgi:RNA polymerase sigma-70 factor (ECF subfamily)
MDREQEFRATLELYRNRVFTLAFYQLGGNEEAEDATQEVFVRLWRNWNEVSARDSPGPWLIRVTRNHCIDLLRKRNRRRGAILEGVDEETIEAAPSGDAGPRAALETERTRERLEAAIQELDEPFRSVVVLREIEEWSYNEIAEGLETSLDQVKVNLHRARKKLREKFLEREKVHDA